MIQIGDHTYSLSSDSEELIRKVAERLLERERQYPELFANVEAPHFTPAIDKAGPQPGIYWVWFNQEWRLGKMDGEDWDIEGTTFSYRELPLGPRCPDKPTNVPVAPEPYVEYIKQNMPDARRANAETPQPATESREGPQHKSTEDEAYRFAKRVVEYFVDDDTPADYLDCDIEVVRDMANHFVASIEGRRANANPPQPANESREEPQPKNVQQKQASHE